MKLRQDVRDWVVKAEEDYAAAQALLRRRKPYLNNTVCFHAQQCAEKYLKAFLTSRQISFPKTHDLLDLLRLAEGADPSLELLRPNLEYLQPYAVDFRYPGEFATRAEALKAALLSRLIREVLREHLQLS